MGLCSPINYALIGSIKCGLCVNIDDFIFINDTIPGIVNSLCPKSVSN